MRLIDAEPLMDDCEECISIEWNRKVAPTSWADAEEEFLERLKDAAVIDAVPVIRCKVCGHSFWLTDERGRRLLCCTEMGKRGLQEDSFCSFGKVSDV